MGGERVGNGSCTKLRFQLDVLPAVAAGAFLRRLVTGSRVLRVSTLTVRSMTQVGGGQHCARPCPV